MITPIQGYNGTISIGSSGNLPIKSWSFIIEPKTIDITGLDVDRVEVLATTITRYTGTVSAVLDSTNDIIETLDNNQMEVTSVILSLVAGTPYVTFDTVDDISGAAAVIKKLDVVVDIEGIILLNMELQFIVPPVFGSEGEGE